MDFDQDCITLYINNLCVYRLILRQYKCFLSGKVGSTTFLTLLLFPSAIFIYLSLNPVFYFIALLGHSFFIILGALLYGQLPFPTLSYLLLNTTTHTIWGLLFTCSFSPISSKPGNGLHLLEVLRESHGHGRSERGKIPVVCPSVWSSSPLVPEINCSGSHTAILWGLWGVNEWKEGSYDHLSSKRGHLPLWGHFFWFKALSPTQGK